jgi:hypothetical protein
MDDAELNAVLLDADERQFWIVLWGDPDHSPEEDDQVFNLEHYDQGFPRSPVTMSVGDILIVHRIHVSKVIFVAETIELPRESTPEEAKKDWWRVRWQWSVATRNLTPKYGAYWKRHSVKPFDLARAYNKLNPGDKVTLGVLNHGSCVRVSESFALFVLNEIIKLPLPLPRKR